MLRPYYITQNSLSHIVLQAVAVFHKRLLFALRRILSIIFEALLVTHQVSNVSCPPLRSKAPSPSRLLYPG